MDNQRLNQIVAYTLIAAGLVVACIAGVVPHYTAGYTVRADVLLAGFVPYLVYGVAVPLMPNRLVVIAGLVTVAVHAGLVANERFVQAADYSDGMIYYGPMILAAALIPLVVIALRNPWDGGIAKHGR